MHLKKYLNLLMSIITKNTKKVKNIKKKTKKVKNIKKRKKKNNYQKSKNQKRKKKKNLLKMKLNLKLLISFKTLLNISDIDLNEEKFKDDNDIFLFVIHRFFIIFF